MATKIIFVRHGLTPWNYIHRYQGHTDVALSDDGINQALALKKRFMKNQLEAIYSSDLIRAVKTAEIINEAHQLPLQIIPELREMNFGVWEGLIFTEIAEKYPELSQKWLHDPHLVQLPKGECIAMVQARGMQAIKQIIPHHPNGQVIIVSHGILIASVICGLLGRPLTSNLIEYKQENTAVSILTVTINPSSFKYEATLDLFNDLTHLEDS